MPQQYAEGQRLKGSDGNVYVVHGGVPVMEPAPRQPMTIGTPDPTRAAAEIRAERADARAAAAAERAANQAPAGYQWSPDHSQLIPIPGGPADTATRGGRGKPMRQGDADKLESQVSSYSYLKDSLLGFKKDYAGNTYTGELENWAQGKFGTGTPGQREWWANFRTADNLIRNQLYGASLTAGEKQAYDQTTVHPGMTPETVRENLVKRTEVVRKALMRRIGRLHAAGFNKDEINAATGEFAPDFSPTYKPPVPLEEQGQQENAPPDFSQNVAPPGVTPSPPSGGATPPPPPQGPLGGGTPPEQADRSGTFIADPASNPVKVSIATGAMAQRPDPANAALIDRMVRAGATADEINIATHQANPNAAGGVSQASVDAAQAWLKTPQGRSWKGSMGSAIELVPVAEQQRNRGGALLSPLGTGAAHFLNAGGLGLTGALSPDARRALDVSGAVNPKSAFAGDLAGMTTAAGGTELAMKAAASKMAPGMLANAVRSPIAADALYGAAAGATGNPDDPLAGAGAGLVGSVGGGMAGRATVRAGSAMVGGVRNEAARYLADRGVQLMPGQIFGASGPVGRVVKGVEDKLESVPFVGDAIKAGRARSLEGANREAFAQQAKAAGLPTSPNIGEQGVEDAFDRSSQSFGNALSGRTIPLDAQAMAEAGAARARGSGAPTYGPDFSTIMKEEIDPITGMSPAMSGEQFQQLDRTLGGYQRQYGQIARGTPVVPPAPMAGRVSSAFGDVQDALSGAVQRGAPDLLPAYGAAKDSYRLASVLRDATDRARNTEGVFTMAQLGTAAKSNAKKFGGTQGTTNQPFFDLVSHGQKLLPSKVPDSGTAGRLALPLLLGASAGGSEAAGLDPSVTGTLAALSLLYTKTGQKAAQKALLSRPGVMRKAGDAINKYRRLGGIFGAPLGIGAGQALLPSR